MKLLLLSALVLLLLALYGAHVKTAALLNCAGGDKWACQDLR